MFPAGMPSLSFGSGAGGGTAGAPSAWHQGDWNVNVAGSGVSAQGSPPSLLLIALAVGAAWLLLRRK
jgi:uncharacterized protein (TIGR03382 family)